MTKATNVKNLLEGIVGKEGYAQLEKAIASHPAPEDFMKVIVVPRSILSWVAQCVHPLKKGEAGAAPMPGSEGLRTRFTRHENHVDIDIIAPTGKSIYQFKEEPIVPFFAKEYSTAVEVPKIVRGLIGLNNISVGDSEYVAGLAKSADFKQLTSIVGKLIDALVAKKLTLDNADGVISSLGKNIKEKTESGEEIKIEENKRVGKVMAEQDKANLKEAPTHEQMEGTSGYKVPHIKAKKVEAGAAAVTGKVKEEKPFKKEEIAPKPVIQTRLDERDQNPTAGNPPNASATKPKRTLRSLLMKPVHAAIQGASMIGAATVGANPVQQNGQKPSQTGHKLNVQDMKQTYQAAKNPIPQPKPAPVQVVQQAQQPVKKDEKLSKPYVSQAQAGFFHTNPEKVGGASVVKEWDQATKGKHLPKHVKKGDGCGIVAMAEDKVAKDNGGRNKLNAAVRKDDSLAAGIAAAGAANGGGQGNADLTRYAGKAEPKTEKQEGISMEEKPETHKYDVGDILRHKSDPHSIRIKKLYGHDKEPGYTFEHNDGYTSNMPAKKVHSQYEKVNQTAEKAEPSHDNAPGFDFDSKKMDKSIPDEYRNPSKPKIPEGHEAHEECDGHGKIYNNNDPKSGQYVICPGCKGQGHVKPQIKKDESGTTGGAGATPGLALAEMPGGAGIPKPGAGAQMPKPAIKPSNNPMGAAAKQSMQSGMGKPAGPKIPGAGNMKTPGATIKPPTAGIKPPAMAGAGKPPMIGKDEKNPDMKADARLGENVEHIVERHMNDNKEAERKEGHEMSKGADYFRGKLSSARKGEGVSSVRNDGVSSVRNPGIQGPRNPGVSSIRNEGVKSVSKPVQKPVQLPTKKADYPADGTEKSEKFYSVSTEEMFTHCEHCGKPEFATGSDGSPVFTPCACFRVMRKDENEKPYKFVAISKKEDGSFALKFNPTADPEAIHAFLLTLKSRLLINKRFGV